MSVSAIAMMAAICGLVWGGFVCCLLFVIRKEREKAAGRGGRSGD